MTEKKVEFQATLDSSPFEDGARRVAKSTKEMSDGISRESEKARKEFEKLPEQTKKSSADIERESGRIIAAIKRQTAELNALAEGTGRAGAEINKIAARGLDPERFAPYLAQLRQAEERQRAVTGQLDQMGLSAKQTTAALRQVPAQFTDIVTSLQAGQAPLTVLLQQGGQLKDSFGGAGAAAQALGGYVVSLINPFTILAAAAAAVAAGFVKGSAETSAFARSLVLSGNAAGTTASQLSEMAQAINKLGGSTVGKAADALAQMASTGRIGSENLERFTAAAIQLERVGGPAVEKTVDAFADLAKTPLQAALKLNEATNFLTRSTYEQIKALEEQGRTTDAAKAAQEAYAAVIEQRAPAIISQLGLVQSAWMLIKDATKAAGDAVLSIGRSSTTDQLISTAQAQIAGLESQLGGLTGRNRGQVEAQIAAAKTRLELLQQSLDAERQQAKWQADQVALTRAQVAWDKEVGNQLDKNAKLGQDALRIRNLGLAAGKSEAEIQREINALVDKWSDKKKNGDDKDTRDLERQIALYNQLNGFTSDYARNVKDLIALRDRGLLTEREYVDELNKLIARQPFAVKAAKEQADAIKDQVKAINDAAEAWAKYIAGIERAATGDANRVQALEDEFVLLTQGKEALERRVQLRMEEAIAALELEASQKLVNDADGVAYEALRNRVRLLQQELDLRRGVAAASDQKAQEEAAKRSAEQAAREWQKTADQIEQSLTDALMQGGKSGAEYIRGLFRSMVLRPVIQAIVNPIVGAGAGLIGLSGAAQAAGGASSGLGLLGASSVFGNFGGGILAGSRALLGEAGFGGAISAAGTALQAGNISGGLGTALGAVGPYLAAATAIYSIARSLDKSGSPHLGSVITVDAQGRASTGGFDPSGILRNLNPQTDTALRSLGGGAVNLLNMLGGGGFSAQARFTADGVDPSFGAFSLVRNGQTVGGVTGGQPDGARAYGSDRQQAFEAFASDVAKATRAALDQIDLPSWAREQINALGDGADLDKLTAVAQQIKATTDALNSLSAGLQPLAGSLSQLANLGSDSLMNLATLSGGIDALSNSLTTYYTEFFTEAERADAETRRITAALAQFGLSLPKTREEFRDLVDAQIALGEAGQPALAALLGVSGAFAQLNPIAEQAAEAVRDAADVLRERQGLETQLLQLQGNTSALRERELAALDPANRALQLQINALADQRSAAEAAAAALQAAAAATERVRAAQSGLISSLQALQQFGQGLRDAVAGVQSQIAALRQTAAQGVTSASDQVRQAAQALGQTAAQTAQAVTAAAAAMEQARQRRAAAALSVQSAIAGQRGTVGSARDALGLLLGQLGGNVAAAQQRVAEVQGRAANSTERLSDVMSRLSDSISGYLAELTGSADAAGPRRLDVLRAQFEQTAALARAGDALAASQLVGAARSLVDASRGGAASGAAFDADVRLVRRVLAEVGTVAGGFGGNGVADDNGLAQALADLATAQTIYQNATAQAAALGVTQTQQVDAWSAAVASVVAAQSTLDSMISRAAAAGIDTSLQATADAFDGLVGDYAAAGTALTDAINAWATAQQSARIATSMYEDAQRRAAAAGVSVAESLGGIEAQQAAFEEALRSLTDAQQIAAQVGADQALVTADLVTQYRGLEQELRRSQEAVRQFEEDVARVDFSPLQELRPLGDLLQQYADAVQTLLGAQRDQQRMSATEQWTDIGNGLQRFVSSGGATAVSRIGGTAADLTVFGRDGSVFGGQAVKDWVAEQAAKGDLGAIYARATALGVSSNSLQLLTGAGDSVLEWARRNGLPAFATGSSYVQGTGLAVVHEGERILPAADNARLMSVLAGTGDMAAEMRALREEVQQLRQEQRAGLVAVAENTRSTAKQLGRVIVEDRLQVDTAP